LLQLAILGGCHNRCGVNWPERTILGCKEMSGDHFGLDVVKFGGD